MRKFSSKNSADGQQFICTTGNNRELVCTAVDTDIYQMTHSPNKSNGNLRKFTQAQDNSSSDNLSKRYGPEAIENIKKALARLSVRTNNRMTKNLVSSSNLNENTFLAKLNDRSQWRTVFDDCFKGHQLNNAIWNITEDDSTGGFNNALQAYNNNDTDNIKVNCGKLTITAKAEWYVQPIGCKNVCVSPGDYNPARAARPYTSGAINTHNKVDVNWAKPGYIEFKFQSSGGCGSFPVVWLYPVSGPTSPGPFGGWSASGELDIMEIWHGPVGQTNAFGAPFNAPQAASWFGGSFPDNALLLANTTLPSDPTGTGWHTVQFSWDSQGLFVWKLDNIVNFIVGPSNYQVRYVNDVSSPLVINPYSSYISIVGNPVVSNQPYQGVYVGYDDNGGFAPGGNLITTNPSPSPFDASNPHYLMIELQVGGNTFSNIAPDNGAVFYAGNSVDLSNTPDGLLSNYDAQQLGLPQRPQSYFTNDQTLKIEYVKYLQGTF